jgi:hypothetical protein
MTLADWNRKILNSLKIYGDFLQLSGNRLIFAPFKHSNGRKLSPIGGYFYGQYIERLTGTSAPRVVSDNDHKDFPV